MKIWILKIKFDHPAGMSQRMRWNSDVIEAYRLMHADRPLPTIVPIKDRTTRTLMVLYVPSEKTPGVRLEEATWMTEDEKNRLAELGYRVVYDAIVDKRVTLEMLLRKEQVKNINLISLIEFLAREYLDNLR